MVSAPQIYRMQPERICYLCGSDEAGHRPGSVRDNPDLKICECKGCGLVYLSSFTHAGDDLYEDSGMHGDQPLDIDKWLADTAADDERRYRYLKSLLPGKALLDFGCGAGGFLLTARKDAKATYGVELERRLQKYFREQELTVYESLECLKAKHGGDEKFDLITMFHVLEHLPDPKSMMQDLGSLLNDRGELVIEVPHADDALLTLYECEPFTHFTYWSCHLFLFTAGNLKMLADQTGLRINYIRQVQRYPLSNHMHWLAKGRPGGHAIWHFLDSPEMHAVYEKQLAAIGKCDTLLMSLSR